MSKDADNRGSARFEDLRLTVVMRGEHWQALVEEIGDPDSALSDGTDYSSAGAAKRGAVSIARELFGTDVPEDIEWEIGDGTD